MMSALVRANEFPRVATPLPVPFVKVCLMGAILTISPSTSIPTA